jgi:hypothetical protein
MSAIVVRAVEPPQPEAEAEPQHALTNALIAELRARLDDMRLTIEDVRRDRDRRIADLARERDEWREEAKRLSLPGPTTVRAAAAPLRWSRAAVPGKWGCACCGHCR